MNYDHNSEDDGKEDSLADKIEALLEPSSFHEPARDFLPVTNVNKLITEVSVSTELEKFEEDLAAKLQGRYRNSYGDYGQQYDIAYRKNLALWILDVAPRLFIVIIQCQLEPIKLMLAMSNFREREVTDKSLPISRHAPKRELDTIFHKKLWTATQRRNFFDKQWEVLVPVFSPAHYDHDLAPECILPFTLLRTIDNAGAFSSVYQVRIHEDHQLHKGLSTVALKQLKVPHPDDGTEADVAWNKEARALKAINKLNHAHIVKCIAAVRKGEKRYLMFPWAEGETLRDYWKNASTKEPSYESIRQIIAQLRGIADALTHLHDYREGRRRSLPGNSLSFTVPVVNGENTDTFGVPQLVKDHTDYDDDLNSSNSVSIRHGDLKPENILRFTESSDGLGVLKIADMGLAKQHMLLTSDRNDKRQLTSTMYGTRPYEAPETITAEYGRSRLYDVWSMGCITLEFIIWILYGNESLTDFYNDIAGGAKKLYQYYEIPDPMNHQHAEVHRVVLKWIKHIESVDPECTQKSAIRDLLAVVKDKLLVVELPPSSTNSGAGGRVLAPPALGEASRFRATAEEFRDALDDILRKADDREYVFTEKNRSDARPPTYTVSPGAAARMDGIETAALANSQGDLSNEIICQRIDLDYSLPPLKNWHFIVDNSFANTVIRRVDSAIFQPQVRKTPSLCARCRSLQFWTGGFSHEVIVSELLESAQTCDLCRMLHEACRDDSLSADSSVLFIRDGSNLLLAGNPSPVLSLVSVPEARITSDFQMGFPELPEPGSDAFFEILRSWLANCDTDHKDSKNLDRDCAGIPKFRLPTRLIDVGAVDAPILRLAKTQEDNIDPQAEYIALSHPWGDISEYIPFQTFWKDPKGTRHEFETFRQAIPESELPGTFRDAVICTRRLGIRYLWIDSICIIQGDDGDFNTESKRMEDVYSGACCVIAASRAKDQRDGFLRAREQRKHIIFSREQNKDFFICDFIDNFNKDVILGPLNRRGWVLQERALARRTIYFTETQTYFECGRGVRCETLTSMHNNMADFLGDPRFPSKAMRNPSRAVKIEYFQDLYRQFSRLDFTRCSDRPFAIAGLEKRLRKAFDTHGGFGIFDDGDRLHDGNGLFHRSLLWKRSEEEDKIREDVPEGEDPVIQWLEPIDFSFKNIRVPTWSWMAYKGAIDYMKPDYGAAIWETKDIIPPWTQGCKTPVAVVDNDVALVVVVRDFNVAGNKAGECKLTYDRQRTTALHGQRAQCVVVARSKEPEDENLKRFFMLLVAAQDVAGEKHKIYSRVGTGFMLGRFISLESKDGVAAKIL